MRIHRELFEDEDVASKRGEPFTISRNLIHRKQEQSTETTSNSLEIDKMFAVNSKEIDSITLASVNTGKFNDFATANPVHKTTTSSSFFASLKSFFKCTNAATKKINEQIQLNYPLNLHLRMNQIFSVHDKLCDIAECFNDLYSIGMFDWLRGKRRKNHWREVFFLLRVIFASMNTEAQKFALECNFKKCEN